MSDYYSPRMVSGVFFNQNVMGHQGMFPNDVSLTYPRGTSHGIDHVRMSGIEQHFEMPDVHRSGPRFGMGLMEPRSAIDNMAARLDMLSQNMNVGIRSPTYLPPDRTSDHVSPTYRKSEHHLQMQLNLNQHMHRYGQMSHCIVDTFVYNPFQIVFVFKLQ